MKIFTKVICFLWIFIILTTCKKEEEFPTFNDQGNINSKGGIVKTKDGASVEIPAGAMTSEKTISITRITKIGTTIDDGCKIYDLKPDGMTFSDSITISLPYEDAFISESIIDINYGIRIMVFENNNWKILKTKIDVLNKTATIKTKHFSEYAVSSPNEFAEYYFKNKNGSKGPFNIPYYNQGDTKWCHFYALSMITKYAGYNFHASYFASLLEHSSENGVNYYGSKELDKKINSLGISTEHASDTWSSVDNLFGYLITKLNDGFPIMVDSPTILHNFVVTGYNSKGFFINDPSGALLLKVQVPGVANKFNNILVTFDELKDVLIGMLDYVRLGAPERTTVVTSKGTFKNFGVSINFSSFFSSINILSSSKTQIGILKYDGKYQPNGYKLLNSSTGNDSFSGSDFIKMFPIASNNNYDEDNIYAKLQWSVDNISSPSNQLTFNISNKNSGDVISIPEFQLYGLSVGNHVLKVELLSASNPQDIYDSWSVNFSISKNYSIAQPTSPNPATGATGISASPTLSWIQSNPDNIPISFDVFIGTTNNPTTKFVSNLTASSTILSARDAGTTYYWKIIAKDNFGNSTTGPIWSFTSASKPTVTTSVISNPGSTSAIVGGSVTLDGGVSVSERGVYWGESSNPETTGTKLQIGNGIGIFSTSLTGLKNSTLYYVNAYAINSIGTSYGSQATFTTSANTAPNAPSSPSPSTGSNNQSTSLTLSWLCSDIDGDEITYDIYFGTDSNPTTIISTNQSASSINQSDLAISTTYYWKIIAKDNKNASTSSPVWSFTTNSGNKPPVTPSNPSPTNTATGQATSLALSWSCSDPDGDPLAYYIYFSTSSNPTTLVSTGQSASSISRNGLAYNTPYYWKIVAKDSKGASTTGPIWSFTTGAEPVNNPPADPTVISPTNGGYNYLTSLTLKWSCSDPDGDPLTYDVYFGTSNNPTSLIVSGLKETSYAKSGLLNGTVYYWKIVAKDNKGATKTGPIWNFTTYTPGNNNPSSPSNPSPASGTKITPSQNPMNLTLSWSCTDPDGDPLTYDVYFGLSAASSPLPLVAQNISSNTFSVSVQPVKNYKWEIIAKDNKGGVSFPKSTWSIPIGPYLNFTISPTSGTTSTLFTFDAGSTVGYSYDFQWDFENDGIWDTGFSNSPVTTHQYTSSGTKTVSLKFRGIGFLSNGEIGYVYDGPISKTVKVTQALPSLISATGTVANKVLISGNIYRGDVTCNVSIANYQSGTSVDVMIGGTTFTLTYAANGTFTGSKTGITIIKDNINGVYEGIVTLKLNGSTIGVGNINLF